MSISKYKSLITTTNRILKHQKEKEILKGEKFNLFSILKMETKENATHSAFLIALLDPQGTHLKGSVFLELFLKQIGSKTIDVSSAKVKAEHHLGTTDYLAKTGGRIDIYIWDNYGSCVSIENKIHAADQPVQIERYCGHNTGKNEVYYLTLQGEEPSFGSKGDLSSGKDFHNLSYKSDIVAWLQLCMKESYDNPIIRETIKQYIILLKKLTYSMDNNEEKELLEVIIENYDASIFLVNNIHKTIANFYDKVRANVCDSLKEKLLSAYTVELGNKTTDKYAQIWIRVNGYEPNKIYFGIQSFSVYADPTFGKKLVIGTYVMYPTVADDFPSLGNKDSNWWYNRQEFTNYNGFEIDLHNPELLRKLSASPDFYNGFVDHIVKESIMYLTTNKNSILDYLTVL